MPFEEFLARTEGFAHSHLAPQHEFCLGADWRPLVDHVGRFETLGRT